MNRISLIPVAVLAAFAAPLSLFGQGDPSWAPFGDPHLRNDCRLAYQVLTKGVPAGRTEWALGKIPRCGPLAGQAVVATISALSQPGGAEQNSADALIGAVWGLQDAVLLNGALDIAQDPSKSDVARVEALRVLYGLIDPAAYVSYAALATRSREETVTDDPPVRVGQPLPSDYLARIVTVANAILAKLRTSDDVRFAAEYVGGAARVRLARQ
jgi:hypothetical protein